MITVLRLGHRKFRDARISTHCGLVARAFGADKIIFSGEQDAELLESINDVTERFGGPFEAAYEKNWKKVIEKFDGLKVHLTVYGEDFNKKIPEIKKNKNILAIVGGEKVPFEVYQMVDVNLAVGNQPHSEIGALAVFLNALNGAKKDFQNKQMEIFPKKCGKNIKEYKEAHSE